MFAVLGGEEIEVEDDGALREPTEGVFGRASVRALDARQVMRSITVVTGLDAVREDVFRFRVQRRLEQLEQEYVEAFADGCTRTVEEQTVSCGAPSVGIRGSGHEQAAYRQGESTYR